MDPEQRRSRLDAARLYFVCDAGLDPIELEALLEGALAGGTDLIQLRDSNAPPGALRAAASLFAEAAREHGALFIVNDDPGLAAACGADGVHVGQADVAVADARGALGPGAIVGLSTHDPEQLAAAAAASDHARPDYVSVGPVWETPTKPGRPAAGLEYVRHAAAVAGRGELPVPWFAIGGIDVDNVDEVRSAGAERIVVVRAIRGADDPRGVAAALREGITAPVGGVAR